RRRDAPHSAGHADWCAHSSRSHCARRRSDRRACAVEYGQRAALDSPRYASRRNGGSAFRTPERRSDPCAGAPSGRGLTVGIAGRVARAFLRSKLTPLVTLASLAVGLLAIIATPREEEPQISVPMIDVMLGLPGATPTETEN